MLIIPSHWRVGYFIPIKNPTVWESFFLPMTVTNDKDIIVNHNEFFIKCTLLIVTVSSGHNCQKQVHLFTCEEQHAIP